MPGKRQYDIAFVGLKPGVHEFFYELDDRFFADRNAEDLSDVQATVKLSLEKLPGLMRLKFEVGGKTNVTCDRCGNPLHMNLWDEFNMIVKMTENPDEMNEQEEDPDVYYISHTESHLNVADWMYEFVLLSLPMQRMCSEEEMGGPQCNTEVLEKLKNMEENIKQNNSNSLWKGLDKFKDN